MLLRVPKQYLVIKVYNRVERKISFSLQVGGIRLLSLSIQYGTRIGQTIVFG